MFALLNQYSYLLISFLVLMIAFFLIYRTFSLKVAILAIFILLFAVVLFRNSLTTSSNNLTSISDWNSIRDSGSPVLLYLYSDLCKIGSAKRSRKTFVCRIRGKFGTHFHIVRSVWRYTISNKRGTGIFFN